MFENDIQEKVKNSNSFEVIYKKDKFVLNGKEYPIGYTSYIANKDECRFMDDNLFKALLGIYDDLLRDFTKENLDYYHKGIIYVLNSLKDNPMFALLGVEKDMDKIDRLFSARKKNHYLAINDFKDHGIDLSTAEKADYADEVMHSLNDFLSAMAIGEIIYNSVLELKEYAGLVFQITHRIVERGARNKSQLADAFGEFLSDEYMQFIFRTASQPFKTRATVMPVIENVNGENHIFRKVYYNNVKDFLNTDLFEGYIQSEKWNGRRKPTARIICFGRSGMTRSEKTKASANTMKPYLPRQRNILMTVSTKHKSIVITRKRNLRRIWKWRIFTKRQRKC